MSCVEGVQEAQCLSDLSDFALAIVDLNLSDGNGTDLISFLKKRNNQIQSILITGECSVNVTIIELMKKKIFDFIPKPFEASALLNLVKEVLRHRDLIEQNKVLKDNIKKQFHFNQIIGQSESMNSPYGMDVQGGQVFIQSF